MYLCPCPCFFVSLCALLCAWLFLCRLPRSVRWWMWRVRKMLKVSRSSISWCRISDVSYSHSLDCISRYAHTNAHTTERGRHTRTQATCTQSNDMPCPRYVHDAMFHVPHALSRSNPSKRSPPPVSRHVCCVCCWCVCCCYYLLASCGVCMPSHRHARAFIPCRLRTYTTRTPVGLLFHHTHTRTRVAWRMHIRHVHTVASHAHVI